MKKRRGRSGLSYWVWADGESYCDNRGTPHCGDFKVHPSSLGSTDHVRKSTAVRVALRIAHRTRGWAHVQKCKVARGPDGKARRYAVWDMLLRAPSRHGVRPTTAQRRLA